jgi:hypothetical protein
MSIKDFFKGFVYRYRVVAWNEGDPKKFAIYFHNSHEYVEHVQEVFKRDFDDISIEEWIPGAGYTEIANSASSILWAAIDSYRTDDQHL